MAANDKIRTRGKGPGEKGGPPPERRDVLYRGEPIEYTLLRSARRSIEFAVRPDCTVLVRAPAAVPAETLDRKVEARGRWILEHLAYFRHYAPPRPAPRYLAGEEHLFLGRRYRLRLEEARCPSVRIEGEELVVSAPGRPEGETVRRLLAKWYRAEALPAFEASLDRCWPPFAGEGRPRPALRLRKMRRCWGTMSSRGRMTLNTDLVRASPEAIDFVVTHELCHLAHPNHGKGFYDQLDERMADWRQRKRRLETELA